MRNFWKTLAGVQIVVMATMGTAEAADYGAAGPLQVSTSNLAAGEGGSTGGYLVVPSGTGPYPLIIASHGWSASADQQVGWGQQFASWGFVVVAPSFPNPLTPDDHADANIIQALATLYADASHASPAQGKVDPTRVGLEGHSAGGLATTLASVAMHPRATVLFDPVDANSSDGKNALPSVCGPLLGIFAQPSSCNNNEAWWSFANTAAGPEVLFHVVNSTHCDGENQSRALCGSFCGGAADATRQTEYARYATAFFLANLSGDATAASTLTMSALSADTAIAQVTVKGGPDCTQSIGDAGAPPGDAQAPASDAQAPGADSGATADAGHGSADGSAPIQGNGDASAGGDASPGTQNPGSGNDTAPGSPSASGGCACAATGGAGYELTSLALATGLASIVGLRRRTRKSRAPSDVR